MSDVVGYILVGGKSSRFGHDKALIEVEGQPLALRVAEVLGTVAGSVTLVGPLQKYRHLGLRVIPDPVKNFGPLAGILAALEDSRATWNLMVACDMPRLSAEFLKFLLDRARASEADVVLPVDAEGRAEPLCAAYALSGRKEIRRAIDQGTHKITDAFCRLRVQELLPAEYAKLDRDGWLFENMNTLADWDRLAGEASSKMY